ncbi:phosphoglycerate kinase [Brumimicrobium aurantiacum]|uniref:Phosphoglycerate kinase n=1 Tax=Brumimicrobium aurantiacum TaxID=1737063 RepID=A0A3E1EXU1_9FLAO|nr:phosphoglycerate kinase [Brumimicrobium aurantiacum]RFC54372.1 phosphoglycerate kinase [Brumimicrobium aurantiacum]
MKTIADVNFENKRALIRVDFNVPLNEKREVTDNTRIKAAIPSIKKVLEGGGSVVLMSHLGRPKGGYEEKLSLKHIIPELEQLVGSELMFLEDCIGEKSTEYTKNIKKGEVVLLENLRFYDEEKAGDKEFAEKLAQHGDIYINDAFGTAHRAHASTAIIADYFPNDKYFGVLLEKEIKNIDILLHDPKPPTTAIIGGAKVSSKITIIEKLMDSVDQIIIGGGMAYTFVKALGGSVGNSLVEDDYIETANKVLEMAKNKEVQIHLPSDTVIADKFANDANSRTCNINSIPEGWMGLDIGTDSIELFNKVIQSSKSILWNGPMGVFEMESFNGGTVAIANALVNATKNGAFTLIGGGDSVAAINLLGLADEVSYVSTGGGAMLEYLEGKELPGIESITKD